MAVCVERGWLSDLRVAALGAALGYNHYEARGRLLELWQYCDASGTTVVGELLVLAALGAGGPEALCASGLGRRVEGGIAVEAPVTASETTATVRKRTAAAPRDGRGRFRRRSAVDPVVVPATVPERSADGAASGVGAAPVHVHADIQTCSGANAPKPKRLTAEELVASVKAREGWCCDRRHLERYWPRVQEEARDGFPEDLVASGMRALEEQCARERDAGGPGVPSLGALLGVLRKFRPRPERRHPERERRAPRPAQRVEHAAPEPDVSPEEAAAAREACRRLFGATGT